MARRRKNKASKKERGVGSTAESAVTTLLHTIEAYKKWFALVLVVFIALAGFLLRMQPALRYGYELHANDPWIMYWMNKQLALNGPQYWYHLNPAEEPEARLFWYPWGRDFTHTEYPLSSMIFAITYPLAKALGLTIKEYSVVEPALAGFFMILAGYLLVRRIAGELAGVLAAFLLAFVPGAVERTIAGFIEKQGLAMPLVLLHMYFLAGVIKRTNLKEAILAGITLGLVPWTWGGYQGIMVFTAATIGLLPLLARTSQELLKSFTVLVVLALVLGLASPNTGYELIVGPGGILLASIPVFYVAHLMEKGRLLPRFVEKYGIPRLYLGIVVVLGVLGLILIFTGVLDFTGRVLAFIGKRFEDPLVASVSEHQILPARFAFNRVGVPLLLTLGTLVLTLLRGRRMPELLVVAIPGAVSIYLAFRSAYMAQTVATMLSVAGAAVVMVIGQYLTRSVAGGKRGGPGRIDTLGVSLALVSVVVVFGFASLHIPTSLQLAEATIPSIMSGGIGLTVKNLAWIYTLDFLKNDTSPNSLVVAWWDYGYWITVGGDRASVADGATMNGTQIRLLAKALTAQDEAETLDIIFNKFKAPPNDTYILVFDVFRSLRIGNATWLTGPYVSVTSGTVGLADIPKSIWMLRIGGRLNLTEFQPYFVPRVIATGPNQQFVVTTPNWTDDLVTNTMIYRLLVHGVESIGSTWTGGCSDLDGQHFFVDWTTFQGTNITMITAPPLENIKPYKTIVDCIADLPNEKLYVAVFLFKATPPSGAS